MAVRLKDLIHIIERTAPLHLKEEWDNPGLAVGDPEQMISKVMVGMDVTMELIEEARAAGAQLILTHHPMLFHRPDSITPQTIPGRKILSLVQNGISAYSAHTNLDKASSGMNDRFMELLGFREWTVLDPSLDPADENAGIGRMASIKPVTLRELAARVQASLGLEGIRMAGDPQRLIETVGVINGSGAEFIRDARKMGINCIITGDTKYHEVLDALEEDLCIIDPGHFASEWMVFQQLMADIRDEAVSQLGEVEFLISRKAADPYQWIDFSNLTTKDPE